MPLPETLTSWAHQELAAWPRDAITQADAAQHFTRLNDTQPAIALFHIAQATVTAIPKPQAVQDPGFQHRISLYAAFLQKAAQDLPGSLRTTICLTTDDHTPHHAPVPVFGFQKRRGGTAILLPDIDCLLHDFYRNHPSDRRAYLRKRAQAVFTGATTGAMITPQIARAQSAPRLRSAAYFMYNPRVDFRLPRIAQCTEPEAEAILATYPFCRKPALSWQEQFESRCIISIDGNGATCSRVAIVLASNSVLLKYASDHVLYYFRGLQPWVHYVPIETDQEIDRILDLEAADPARFQQIAAAGRDFAQTYLTEEAARLYTSALLEAYAGTFPA